MGGERSSTTIGRLISTGGGSIKTGPFGTALKASEYSSVGVPLISVGEIGYGTFRVHQSTPRVPTEVTTRLPEYLLQEGDIVFGRKGAVDRSARISAAQAGWFLGSDGIRLRLPSTADSRFMAYQLQSPESRSWIMQHATGTTMASLNQDVIARIPVLLPPLPEQRAIAHILGTLDDKIELNRRRNQTLEAMARALFKDWFIDFGPVHAKLEGREPYLPPDLWQLFPERLDDEGKPAEWESGRLDDALVLQRGFDLPASDRTHGVYPVMAASGINGYHDKFMVKGPGITTGRSGVLGRVFLIQSDFWPLNTSLWVKEFKRVSPCYAFELLRGLDFEMFNAGSAVPTLNRNHVHNLPITLPPKQLIDAFDELVVPMAKARKSNEDESQTLAKLRDTLLPKLISGELCIAKAERILETHR
jgi:type I restriction enzyme S subunit